MFLDDRHTAIHIGTSVTIGRTTEDFVRELRLAPLMFGAAWKMLDVLVEHAMRAAGLVKPRYSIAEKVKWVGAGKFVVQPLAQNQTLWERVCVSYVRAAQY